MTPTSEERREVAARLHALADRLRAMGGGERWLG